MLLPHSPVPFSRPVTRYNFTWPPGKPTTDTRQPSVGSSKHSTAGYTALSAWTGTGQMVARQHGSRVVPLNMDMYLLSVGTPVRPRQDAITASRQRGRLIRRARARNGDQPGAGALGMAAAHHRGDGERVIG